MPVYEYECQDCGAIEEALQKFSEKPLEKCSGCSGRLHKLVSHSSFHLKGSGWYVTDYAKNSKKDSTGDPGKQKPGKKEASASADKKIGKKADNKPGDKKVSQTK